MFKAVGEMVLNVVKVAALIVGQFLISMVWMAACLLGFVVVVWVGILLGFF